MAETSLLKEEKKENLKRDVRQAQGGTGARMMRWGQSGGGC